MMDLLCKNSAVGGLLIERLRKQFHCRFGRRRGRLGHRRLKTTNLNMRSLDPVIHIHIQGKQIDFKLAVRTGEKER